MDALLTVDGVGGGLSGVGAALGADEDVGLGTTSAELVVRDGVETGAASERVTVVCCVCSTAPLLAMDWLAVTARATTTNPTTSLQPRTTGLATTDDHGQADENQDKADHGGDDADNDTRVVVVVGRKRERVLTITSSPSTQ